MQGKSKLTIAMAAAVLAVGGTVVNAQDKYSLKSPDGIAFSDFKGYEAGRWCLPREPTRCSR